MKLPQTLVHALHDRASQLGERPALWTRRGGRYHPTSWRDYERRVKHFALGLQALGLARGATVAILGFNREEWLVAHLAAVASGAVPFGIYTTSSPEQVEYILGHSKAQVVILEHEGYLPLVAPLRQKLPGLLHVILMETPRQPAEGCLGYVDVLSRGLKQSDTGYWERLNGVDPRALSTLIYTSGTTGHPKAVMLSQHNVVWTAQRLTAVAGVREGEVLLSYLPLSHIAEQLISLAAPLLVGMEVYFAESLDKLPEDLRAVRPTAFFGVPRVWEKFKASAEAALARQPRARAQVAGWARRVALERNRHALAGERLPRRLEAQYLAAQQLVFRALKDRIGFDRCRLFATSAAPIALEVLEFFASLDIVIREVYGQSEVTGPTSVNTPEETRLGTVGRPLLGVEVRIADDGEILVRGPNVCLGYFEEPQATAELIDAEGWLHSGDLGDLDAQGYLRITGRKKELLVTSGGKKTAPAHLEGLLKGIAPLGNAMVVGDRRSYLVAVLALDPEKVGPFARAHRMPQEPAALAQDPAFRRYLTEKIDREVNARLSRFETIKAFGILPRDFTVEAGELTPTLKLRRKVAEQKHRALIEQLYATTDGKAAGAG